MFFKLVFPDVLFLLNPKDINLFSTSISLL